MRACMCVAVRVAYFPEFYLRSLHELDYRNKIKRNAFRSICYIKTKDIFFSISSFMRLLLASILSGQKTNIIAYKIFLVHFTSFCYSFHCSQSQLLTLMRVKLEQEISFVKTVNTKNVIFFVLFESTQIKRKKKNPDGAKRIVVK